MSETQQATQFFGFHTQEDKADDAAGNGFDPTAAHGEELSLESFTGETSVNDANKAVRSTQLKGIWTTVPGDIKVQFKRGNPDYDEDPKRRFVKFFAKVENADGNIAWQGFRVSPDSHYKDNRKADGPTKLWNMAVQVYCGATGAESVNDQAVIEYLTNYPVKVSVRPGSNGSYVDRIFQA